MNEKSKLRAAAKERFDAAIAKAKADYDAELARIDKLHPSLFACVKDAVPHDRLFTIEDIVAALKSRHPGRDWKRQSVVVYVSQMASDGLIRRIRKPGGKDAAVYASTEYEGELPPFYGMTLREIVASMLAERNMNATELTVAILEAGYPFMTSRKALLLAVSSAINTASNRTGSSI